MNKYFIIILSCSIFSNAQNITFSDVNFKNALVNTNCVNNNAIPGGDVDADINNDGEIDMSEALLINNLSISNQNIVNIDEISYFSNLENLNCSGNQITSINFLNNNVLHFLYCNDNPLTTLNLNNLPNLTDVYCYNNLFTNIDLSTTGFVQGDFSNNPNLQTIQLKNGITNMCIILLSESYDYTCSMFLNCPALRQVCLDQQDLDSTIYYSHIPQNLVVFNTNSDCTLSNLDFEKKLIKIYPNPINDIIKIDTDLLIKKINIYNSIGQTVIQNTSNSKNIDVSQLEKGYYFIEIISEQGKKFEKILK